VVPNRPRRLGEQSKSLATGKDPSKDLGSLARAYDLGYMDDYSVSEAAGLLGVSPDTIRRWVDGGDLEATRTRGGHRRIAGVALAKLAQTLNDSRDPEISTKASARNHFAGIVTKVVKDKVMAQVEMQAGPFRVVALISREAVDDMELAPGSMVNAVVKATNVTIEHITR
jgi:molybdopterin-binding protein